jgi:hypothetical protein
MKKLNDIRKNIQRVIKMKWKEILKTDEEILKRIKWDGNAKDAYTSILNEIPYPEKKKLFRQLVTKHWKRNRQPITANDLNRLKSEALEQYGSSQSSSPTQTAPDYGRFLNRP